MIKIYVQNKPLFLVDSIDNETSEYLHRSETIFIDELNMPAVKTMLHELEQPQYYTGIFVHKNIEELLNAFKSHLYVIQAAGGLVHTKKNDVLLIFRRGKWDLPKGKLDENEDLETCALREISEETGVGGLSIRQPLAVTYHTYYEKSRQILKESHWYLVQAKKKTALTPQKEEDIEEGKWVSIEDVPAYIDQTYGSIKDVLKKGLKILQNKP